jgi:hypothetical protein
MSYAERFLRRDGPLLVMIVVAIISMLPFFVISPVLDAVSTTIQKWAAALVGVTFIIGIINLTQVHLTTLRRRIQGQWPFSIVLIILLYTTLIAGFVYKPIYDQIFQYIYTPINGAVYAMLAFFIFGATYRALGIKSVGSFLFTLLVFIFSMRNCPFIAALIPQLEPVYYWVLNIPVAGANRGMIVAASIGLILYAFRIFIGKERAQLGMAGEV